MKMWGTISTFLSLILFIYVLFFIYQMDDEVCRQFAEQRLRYAVDYATEAAFREALESDNIGIDYTDITDVQLSPTNALTTFESLICLNFDISLDDNNLAYIESFIPTAIMICSDGYYIARTTESGYLAGNKVLGGLYRLRWGLKKPYMFPFNDANNDYVAFSLNGKALYEVKTDVTGDIVQETLYENGKDSVYTSVWSYENCMKDIVNDANLAIRDRNAHFSSGTADIQNFFVPLDFSTVNANAIKQPSFIAMIQNAEFAGHKKVSAMSVGGEKVVEKQMVVAFSTSDEALCQKYGLNAGQCYYCWSNDLPDTLASSAANYYKTVDEAALAGYFPAVTLMSNTSKFN